MAQCHEFRSLSGGVPKILAACKMLQISITRFQDVALIHIFPTMYGINLLKTETMVSKNQATEAEGRGSRVFRDHSLGFKKV